MAAPASYESPSPPGAETFRKPTNDTENFPIDGTEVAIETPTGQPPHGDASASERHKKTHPPPQLVNYLKSPSAAGPYTALEASKGLRAVGKREKNMKERIEAWQKDWDKMAPANNSNK